MAGAEAFLVGLSLFAEIVSAWVLTGAPSFPSLWKKGCLKTENAGCSWKALHTGQWLSERNGSLVHINGPWQFLACGRFCSSCRKPGRRRHCPFSQGTSKVSLYPRPLPLPHGQLAVPWRFIPEVFESHVGLALFIAYSDGLNCLQRKCAWAADTSLRTREEEMGTLASFYHGVSASFTGPFSFPQTFWCMPCWIQSWHSENIIQ